MKTVEERKFDFKVFGLVLGKMFTWDETNISEAIYWDVQLNELGEKFFNNPSITEFQWVGINFIEGTADYCLRSCSKTPLDIDWSILLDYHNGN